MFEGGGARALAHTAATRRAGAELITTLALKRTLAADPDTDADANEQERDDRADDDVKQSRIHAPILGSGSDNARSIRGVVPPTMEPSKKPGQGEP